MVSKARYSRILAVMSAVLAFISFLFVSIGTGMPDLLRATYYLSSRPAHTEHDIKLGVFTKVTWANSSMWGNEDTTESLDCASYTTTESNECTKALHEKCVTVKVFSVSSILMLLAAGGLIVPEVRKLRIVAAVFFGITSLMLVTVTAVVASMLYAGDDYSHKSCSPFGPPPVFYARRVEYGHSFGLLVFACVIAGCCLGLAVVSACATTKRLSPEEEVAASNAARHPTQRDGRQRGSQGRMSLSYANKQQVDENFVKLMHSEA